MITKQHRIAIIRIKGDPGLKAPIRKTFELLRLYKKNSCVVIPNTKDYVGMLARIQDSCTWGEVDEETFAMLLEKRGKLPGKQPLTKEYLKEKTQLDFAGFTKEYFAFKKELKDVPGLKPFFTLNPPRKGFERKGTKMPYSLGGALGYRKADINDLLRRMM